MNGTPHRTNASQRRLPLLSKGGQRCDSPWPGANALVPPPRAHARTQPGTTHRAAPPPPDRPAPQRPGGAPPPHARAPSRGRAGQGGARRPGQGEQERRGGTTRHARPHHSTAQGGGAAGGQAGNGCREVGTSPPFQRSSRERQGGAGANAPSPNRDGHQATQVNRRPGTAPREVRHFPPHWGLVRAAARVKRHPQRGELAYVADAPEHPG